MGGIDPDKSYRRMTRVLGRLGKAIGCVASVALFAAVGVALAADFSLIAMLKAAPNVLPVDDSGEDSNRPEAPAAPVPSPSQAERHPARQAIDANPIHDPANPDRDRLQSIDEATRHMKRDAVGFPDWMAALRSGAITPWAGLSPRDKMDVLNLDVVMRNTKEMPFVRFPHFSHTVWLDCSNCHPVPFIPQVGANPISMSEIFRGRYCGMCHDRIAFITFFACERCHSVAQDGVRRIQ